MLPQAVGTAPLTTLVMNKSAFDHHNMDIHDVEGMRRGRIPGPLTTIVEISLRY